MTSFAAHGFWPNIIGLAEGVLLLVAFYGFGHVILSLTRVSQGFRPGLSMATGLSAFILAGGILNLLAAVNRPVIGIVIVAGVALAVWSLRTHRENICSRDRTHWAWFAAGLLIVGWIVTHAATISFYSDDLEGYLFFFEKFAKTGHLGADPFSGKRLYSNIGGYYVVQASLLQFGTIGQMHLFDVGLCSAITILMIVEYLAARRVTPWLCVGVASLACVVDIVFPTTNTASGALRTGLLAMMILVADDETDRFSVGRALIMAILAGACISLKGTMLAAVPAVIGGLFLFQVARNRDALVGLFARYALAGGLALVLNVPYMIAHYVSSGTLLYPVLGSGYHSIAFSTLAKTSIPDALQDVFSNLLKSRRVLSAAALIVMFAFVMRKVPALRTREFAIGAVTMVMLIVVSAVLGYSLSRMGFVVIRDMERYAAPLLGAGFLFSAMAAVSVDAQLRTRVSAVVATITFILVLQATTRDTLNHARQMAINLTYFASGNMKVADALMQRIGDVGDSIVGDEARQAYLRNLQHASQPGTQILALVPRAYLLDFRRNSLVMMECAGSVSPPPGLPLSTDSSALVSYLRARGVRYVMYEHRLGKPVADQPAPSETLADRVAKLTLNPDESVSRWDRFCRLNAQHLRLILTDLATKGGIVRDDGQILLLDLGPL